MSSISVDNVFKQKSFADENIAIIPFIDPDSTRYVEWIWSLQNARGGNDVHLRQYRIPDNFITTTEALAQPMRHRVPGVAYYSKNYFRAVRVNVEKNYPELYFTITSSNDREFVVSAIGTKEETDEIISYYEKNYKTPNTVTIQNLKGFGPDGSPLVRNITLSEEKQEIANESFYPYIPELSNGIDEFIDAYMKSSSSILILWGIWGSGKSAFLRTLLFRAKRANIGLANNAQALGHPGLIGWLESVGESSIIGIEDADLLVKARDTGNEQMSALLNYAEGVIKNDNKLIISTNLTSLKDIDNALIRPGRAYKILRFDKLTAIQSNAARQSIGKEQVFFGGVDKLTLSEALNWSEISNLESHQRTVIGFA